VRALISLPLLLSASLHGYAQTGDAQTTSGPRKNCVPPRVAYSEGPPPTLQPRKDSASTSLDVLVDEKGRVLDPKVITASGSDEFDHDARVTVRRWRWKPSTCDGKPLPVHIVAQIRSAVRHLVS